MIIKKVESTLKPIEINMDAKGYLKCVFCKGWYILLWRHTRSFTPICMSSSIVFESFIPSNDKFFL